MHRGMSVSLKIFVCPYVEVYVDKYTSMKCIDLKKIERLCRGDYVHALVPYSAIYKQIWFFFGTLMHPHILHILLKFQVNISSGF